MGAGNHPGYLDCLDDRAMLRLETVAPEVRRMVEYLVSGHATARLLGLDAIQELVLRQGELAATAPEALPHLFELAGSPRYPHASAILTRLAAVLETIDAPPRSLAGDAAPSQAARMWEGYRSHLPLLLRVARTARDPEAARAAARMVLHFPEADGELTPVLIALLSGAGEGEGRVHLLYALARIQGERGDPLHPRVQGALDAEGPSPEKAAVALALAELALDEPLRSRVGDALRELAEAEDRVRGWPDPRRWGQRHGTDAARRALDLAESLAGQDGRRNQE